MPISVIRYIDNNVDNNAPRWGVAFGQTIAPLGVEAATTGELLSLH